MAVKSHSTNNFLSISSSNGRLSNGSYCVGRKVSEHCLLFSKWGRTRKGCLIQHDLLSLNRGHGSVGRKKYYLTFSKAGRSLHLFLFATSDDGMTVNGSPQADTNANFEKMRVKLDSSLEDENFYDGLVQALNVAARVFELAIKEHKSYSRVSWFSTAWLGVDQTTWVKALSCQLTYSHSVKCPSSISDQNNNNTLSRHHHYHHYQQTQTSSVSNTVSVPTAFYLSPSNFTNSPICYGVPDNPNFHSSLSVMPLKPDGSLCIMEALGRSQSQVMVSSSSPKLEDFLGGATMGTHDEYGSHERDAAMALSLDSVYYNDQQNADPHQQPTHHQLTFRDAHNHQ